MYKGNMNFIWSFNDRLSKADKAFLFDILPRLSYTTGFIVDERYQAMDNSKIVNKLNIGRSTFFTIMSNLTNLGIFEKEIINDKTYYKIHSDYFGERKTSLSQWHKIHAEYLKSKKWKDKRELVLARDNYMCQECESKDNLHVHHLTYKNFQNEPLEDLITLCNVCHAKTHGKDVA